MEKQEYQPSSSVNKLLHDVVTAHYPDIDPQQIKRYELVTTGVKDFMSIASPVFDEVEESKEEDQEHLSFSTVADSVGDSAFFDNLKRHEDLSSMKVEEETNKGKFVETNSFKIAMKLLLLKKRLIITGNPGDGKSTIAYHCLRRCMQKNQDSRNKSRKPWLVNKEEDLHNIGPKDNLTILIDGPFDHISMSDVPLRLLETLSDVTCNDQLNSIIIVMQKEVLQFYRNKSKLAEWFADEIIVDLSQEQFSSKVQLNFLKIYNGDEGLDYSVLPSANFKTGFPELCKILSSSKENQSSINFSDALIELYEKHFQEFEVLPLALLSAVLMNNGPFSIEDFQDGLPNKTFYDDLSVLLGWKYDPIQANDMLVIAKSFESIYLLNKDNKYMFIREEVIAALSKVLFRKNPWKFIDMCPVKAFANLETKPDGKGFYISEDKFKRVISRFIFEIEKHPSSVLFDSLWQCSVWQNYKFRRYLRGKFAKSVQRLDDDMQPSFFIRSSKYKNVGLESYLLIHIPNLWYTAVEKGNLSLILHSKPSMQEDLHVERCTCPVQSRILRKTCTHSTECLFTHMLDHEIHIVHNAIESNSEHLCCFINLCLEFLCAAEVCSFPNGELAHHSFQINICRLKNSWLLPRCLQQKLENSTEGKCILDASQNNYIWMYKCLLESRTYMDKIFDSVFFNAVQKKNWQFRDILIGKALKAFSCIYGQKCKIQDLWIGQKCSKNKSLLTDTLIVILRSKDLGKLPKTFLGLSLLVRHEEEVSAEASSILQHENELYNRHRSDIKLSDEIISNLFSSHSNISLVSSSSVRSMGYHSDSPRIVFESCVVIYCRIKGVIPDNESNFPSEIGGHPVDVRESICHFANNPESLHMGDAIYSESSKQFGTVGVFVDIDQDTKGFITCAHVFCPSYVLSCGDCQKYFNKIELDQVKVYDSKNTQSENSIVGKLRRPVFTNNNPNKVSMDAAIVEFTARKPQNGQFTDNFKMYQLKQAGFLPRKIPTFCTGEIEYISSSLFTNKVIKFGAKSGLTVGHFGKDSAHAQVTKYHEILTPNKTSYKMFHQIEIFPQGKDKFFDEGDSGSCIFIADNTNPPELKCIGLGVAVTSHGSCIMTPIKHVLESLGLKHDSLTKFPDDDDDESDESSPINIGTLKTLLDGLTETLTQNFTDKLTEIKDSTMLNTEKLEKIDQRLITQAKDIKELKGRVSSLESK